MKRILDEVVKMHEAACTIQEDEPAGDKSATPAAEQTRPETAEVAKS